MGPLGENDRRRQRKLVAHCRTFRGRKQLTYVCDVHRNLFGTPASISHCLRFCLPRLRTFFFLLPTLFFFFSLSSSNFAVFQQPRPGPTDKTPASKYVMETQPERTLITSPSLPLFSPPYFSPSSRSPCLCNPPPLRQTHFVSPCASVSYVAACASDLNSQRGFRG